MVGGHGEQRKVARSFDGNSQVPLVASADAGLAPGVDFAPLTDKASQAANVLVVNNLHLVHAEAAYAAAWREAPPSASTGRPAASSSHRHELGYLSFNLQRLLPA